MSSNLSTTKPAGLANAFAMNRYLKARGVLLKNVIHVLHHHPQNMYRTREEIEKELKVFMQVLASVHHDTPTWQSAVLVWVLHTACGPEAARNDQISFDALAAALEWLQGVLYPRHDTSHASKSATSNLESLAPEVRTEIMHHLKRGDKKSSSLTSKALRDAVRLSDGNSVFSWALGTLQRLYFEDHEIIESLLDFCGSHEHLGLMIIHRFSSHTSGGEKLQFEKHLDILLCFIQLVGAQGSACSLPEHGHPLQITFANCSSEELEPILACAKETWGPHSETWGPQSEMWGPQSRSPFAFHLQTSVRGLLRDPSLYEQCAGIAVHVTADGVFHQAFVAFFPQKSGDLTTQAGSDRQHISFKRLTEVQLSGPYEIATDIPISLPSTVERVTITRMRTRDIWPNLLAMPRLHKIHLENVKFNTPHHDGKAIRAAKQWRSLALLKSHLTNADVAHVLKIDFDDGVDRTPSSAMVLHKAVATLSRLELSNNDLSSDTHLDFRSCHCLRTLDVSDNANLKHGLQASLLPPCLEELIATNCGIQISAPHHNQDAQETHFQLNLQKHCPTLKFLDLSHNPEIRYLSGSFVPHSLVTFKATKCSLTAIDQSLRDSKLRKLFVNANGGLKDGLKSSHLPFTLETLNASDCGIHISVSDKHQDGTDAKIQLNLQEDCPALRLLYLQGNKEIKYLPVYLISINLDTLLIGMCSVSKIDPGLRSKRLRKLDISYNESLAKGLITNDLPSGLKSLGAQNCGLTRYASVSHEKFSGKLAPLDFADHCRELEYLNLSYNKGISHLDRSFAPHSLNTLIMRACSLSTIDVSLKDTKLRKLDIDRNCGLGEGYKANHLPVTLSNISASECNIATAGNYEHFHDLMHLDLSLNKRDFTPDELGISRFVELRSHGDTFSLGSHWH